MIDVPEPRLLADDEVLIQVRAAGVGNWDVGRGPPMALRVEAAGVVAAVGGAVTDWVPGDEVMTRPLPLRHQGRLAPTRVAPAALLARKPSNVSWEVAAVFPVSALTAAQVLDEALEVDAGDRLLGNGAGGVTGGLLVALGALRGAQVIATAGRHSHDQVAALGARHVIDQARGLAGSGPGDHRRRWCVRSGERRARRREGARTTARRRAARDRGRAELWASRPCRCVLRRWSAGVPPERSRSRAEG